MERLDPASREQAAYHLGFIERGREPRPARLRARPSARRSPCCRPRPGAPGADVGLPGAVAVELVHNFSLLHDDLMDGDTERRHRRTVWARSGAGRRDPDR